MLTSEIVWKHKFTDQEIETWLSNFNGKVFGKSYEKELALWLLANFVYFNEDEVRHLCKILYRDFIHEMLLAKKNSVSNIENSIKEILNTSRFYNLGRPGESGAYVLYYFRQGNDLPLNNFIYHPNSISKEITKSGLTREDIHERFTSFFRTHPSGSSPGDNGAGLYVSP